MPAEAKNVAGSSLPRRPWCETVSIFTVSPDLIVSAGGRSAVRYPQITVSGVERSVASGVAFGGDVCALADQATPAIMQAKQRTRIGINKVRIGDLPGKKTKGTIMASMVVLSQWKQATTPTRRDMPTPTSGNPLRGYDQRSSLGPQISWGPAPMSRHWRR